VIDADAFKPLPLAPVAAERTEAARAEAEALLAEANRMHADSQRVLADAKVDASKTMEQAKASADRTVQEARGLRARTLGAAEADAKQIRETALAETAKKQHRDDKLDTWAARGIIAGAVGLTASGEYELAKMVGFDPMTAWLLPFVIDVYVIQAFRRHRDILQAIALTVAANVTYHLADAHLFGLTPAAKPTWWLIAMVASVASLILWRVHLMQMPAKERQQRRRQSRQQQPVQPVVSVEVERQEAPPAVLELPPVVAPATASTTANSDRQESAPGAANDRQLETARKAPAVAKKPAAQTRQKAAKKAASKRRSMDEWVDDAGPVFHAEFTRLRRNPTASEFATAISAADLGTVSASTAKNIRAEILDRTPLPELDGSK
jgi:hypothetical protein